MTKFLQYLRPLDILFIGIIIITIICSTLFALHKKNEDVYVKIKAPAGEWLYELHTDKIITIDGKLGTTVIIIQDGTVKINSSPCPQKTCMAKRPISKHGEWIACLPNSVIVFIETN